MKKYIYHYNCVFENYIDRPSITLDPKELTLILNAVPGDYEYLTEMYFKAKAREEAENATIQRQVPKKSGEKNEC